MNNAELLELRKEYQKQKEIEAYQISRTLSVPKTAYAHVVLWSLLYIGIIISICILSRFIALPFALKLLIVIAVAILFSEFYLRFLGVKIVECYQHYAKEDTRRRCLCVPSCSEYAILCLKKFILIKALTKIRKRLYVTCKGGDYIIDWP